MKNGLCKQTAVLVVRINNIGQWQWCFNRLLAIFLTLYFTTYLAWPDRLFEKTLTHITIMPYVASL